jgi:catechol 2,3-dioxygenase-like lactoylglutathione lyase family enzyme
MFNNSRAFSSFSTDDLARAKTFYGETLGLSVKEEAMHVLSVDLPGGGSLIIYPKKDHEPATFTVLNFQVDDIEAAVEALNDKGIQMDRYDIGEVQPDEKGIYRGKAAGHGPDIAWFKDPAGNILAVMSD